jgi:hypothetical protein
LTAEAAWVRIEWMLYAQLHIAPVSSGFPAEDDRHCSLLFACVASPNSERRFAPGVIITEKVLYICRLLLCTKLVFPELASCRLIQQISLQNLLKLNGRI